MITDNTRSALIVGGMTFAVLVAWCVSDPRANVPVIAPAVCAVKGGSWFEQPDVLLGVPGAGCYRITP